jgi:signal transduction histidine kinase
VNSTGLFAAGEMRQESFGGIPFALTPMANLSGPTKPSGDWELFLGMWERANLVRAYFWSHRPDDYQTLLTHFLVRLRRYFSVDFCLGALHVAENSLVEVAVPEAGLPQLPVNFSQRCLESVANSRAPVTWKDVGSGLGFRSTVVVPLRAPTGPSFGFLMLGHTRSRNYTNIELFLLQALAGELSWVVRDLAARKAQDQKLAAASHAIKNALQVIIGAASLLRQKTKDAGGIEGKKHWDGIDTAVEQISARLRAFPDLPAEQEIASHSRGGNIEDILDQSLASWRQAAKERGIDVEVIYAEPTPKTLLLPDRLKAILSAIVDKAAASTRDETVRLTLRRRATDLELMVKGTRSNRVADALKAWFEDASPGEGARDEEGGDPARVREYLEHTGGDVYLKSRPGEAAELVVQLPIEAETQGDRL